MQQFQIASKDYPVTPRGLLTMNAAHSVPSPMVGGGLLTTILGGSSPSEEAEEAAVLQAMVRNNAAIISALLDQKIKDSKG
jgi:hypothetical protein